MKKTYYQLAVRNPGAVAWYCAVKLEMATAVAATLLADRLQSGGVCGRGGTQQQVQAELGARMGLDISAVDSRGLRHVGRVDDWCATVELCEGGIIRACMAVWVAGAPHGQG